MGEKEECNSVHDVEEGEISDSASVEEISEEDFRKQEAKVFNPNDSNNSNSNPRVWTMRDLYKYQVARNYSSVNLHNIAWAHAVQNKPLDGVLVMDLKPNETSNSKRSSNSLNSTEHNNNNSSGGESVNPEVKVVIDVDDDATKMEARDGGEREEGELEEGEIDLDLEVVERVQRADSDKEEMDISTSDVDLKDKELKVENHVNSIREALGTVNTNAVEKSFGGVCARLENSLYSLGEYFMDNSSTEKDFLIQLSLTAIDIANSVFWSMNQSLKEQNRDILSRLLHNVMRHKAHHLFSPEQMREIEAMIASLDSFAVSTSTADVDEKKKIQMNGRVNRSDFYTSNENFDKNLISSKKRGLDSMSVEPLERNDPQMSWESSNSGHPSSKGRGLLLPLLDLHKDHDVDSLPSPTRETPTCFPVGKKLALGDGIGKPEPPRTSVAIEMENVLMHPYETDALKAVSSYQEKFGRSSFFTNDRLPSPTPSEEGNDGDADTSGEVSSASRILNVNSLNVPMMSQPRVSSVPHIDVSIGQSQTNTRNVAPLTSVPNHVSRASARSRDPRLRVANPDAGSLPLNQRHHVKTLHTETMLEPLGEILRHRRTAEEAYLDGPTPKKQRNELTDSSVRMDGQAVSVSGGWLDRGTVGLPVANRNHIVDGTRNDPRKMENEVTAPSTCSSVANVPISGNEQLPVTGVSTPASLQSLLKDIALNPAVWRNIIKMEQQKSVDPERSLTQPPSSNSILGAVPATTTAPTKPSVLVQGLAAMLQSPTTDSMDALGKARMKPRDPRRVLLNQTLQKGVNLGSDQSNGSSTQTQKQDDLPDQKSLSSPSSTPPDITEQFTKNLRHVADIVAVSQASTPLPSVTHIAASQTAQVHPSRVEVKVSSASDDLQSGAGLTSEEAVPSRPQNSWGDVEHLFEGFDDQQKAAFQKERARRIEEQNKMFASRKLCLVLDLDHTLLNSAKFAEVDPVHDDILRKKEEQDREKPQRHLFRFPHMGMWTKLRPGIWNFLEKASKLYELHLYTMGNRIYATEMAKLIDPKGNLFAGRVISRGDDGDISDGDERVPKSKDLEGVLGMESAVVIVDDSVRVWPHNRLNLIVVERYIYFPCSRRQFGLVGPSLLEIDHDERPEDGTLASSLAVIERIHQNFFSRNCLEEVDVRNILSSEQRKILGGCRIVFSRVFPVGEANPHLHPLWQTAEQFGAVCTNQIDEQVTHVVANSLGTDKVNWALSTGRFVVHPGWVEASALLYRRANEHDFAIKQ